MNNNTSGGKKIVKTLDKKIKVMVEWNRVEYSTWLAKS